MKTTEFLGLNVPELADSPPDITKFSENYPKIDANAKSVSSQINSLANGNGTIPEGDNLDLYITPGTHYNIAGSANIANLPPAAPANHNNSVLEIIGQTSQAITQIYYSPQNDSIYVRQYVSWQLPNWRPWKKVLTDKQSDWIVATLQNGWTGNAYYRKNSLEQMEILFNPIIAGTVSDFTTIFTIPVGYRPVTHSPITAYNSTTGESIIGIVVLNSGEVKIRIPATTKIAAGQQISIRSFY